MSQKPPHSESCPGQTVCAINLPFWILGKPLEAHLHTNFHLPGVEICLLLILSDMTKIDEGVGELIDDVTLEDGLDSRTFLRPEYVRVS